MFGCKVMCVNDIGLFFWIFVLNFYILGFWLCECGVVVGRIMRSWSY